jgi:hypothetical protein
LRNEGWTGINQTEEKGNSRVFTEFFEAFDSIKDGGRDTDIYSYLK